MNFWVSLSRGSGLSLFILTMIRFSSISVKEYLKMSPTSPFAISAPHDDLTYLNNLSAYSTSAGNDELLDLYRMLQQSGGYYFQGLSFPNGADTVVGGNQTLNGTLIVPVGTYITGITQFYLAQEERGAAAIGFKMKVFDKGSKESIFYLDYCIDGLVGRA